MNGKHILLGVTGGIAAYKSAYLTRLLVRAGAEVRCLMTPSAKQFITPLTLATLSRNPVYSEGFDPEDGRWNSHVGLGLWADAYVIAPATANTLAKLAHGLADNLLLTTALSARCPLVAAPAMDCDMLRHPATQANLALLRERGVHLVEPTEGELASGLEGKGRMAEPDEIALQLAAILSKDGPLSSLNVLITAGPTREAIDPVRFISNHSSGKMGYALAGELAARGCHVELVTGPVALPDLGGRVRTHHVETATQMLDACLALFPQANAAIMTAAVADYRPAQTATEKIKRNEETLTLTLTANPDIAAHLGRLKRPDQALVGFALETSHGLEHARHKLAAKNLDMIVLNTLGEPGVGFAYDTNRVTIIESDGGVLAYGLKPKRDVAIDIVEALVPIVQRKAREAGQAREEGAQQQ